MHALFLRILKDCAEFTRLKKNDRTFDGFDQKYFIYRKMYDFKTDRKPDGNNLEDMVRSENYRRQLEVYSHIVEQKFGKKVSKMLLHYTRVEDETPCVTWDYEKERVAGTHQSFSRTVAKIESHQFSNAKARKCARLCDGCDMRFYCGCK